MTVDEVWADDLLLAFDGRVIEVFGFPGSESMRFHVENLELTVEHRSVTMKPAMRGGGCAFAVPEDDWPDVERLLDAVLAAMPDG